MTRFNAVACLLLLSTICFSQQYDAAMQSDFIEFQLPENAHVEKCLDDVERKEIKSRINKAICDMRDDGLFDRVFGPQHRAMPPSLQWPMRQADGFNDPSYYAISNYVDLDPTSPGVLDYNGLNQTYDGHDGIDIRLAPYFWKKMADSHVEAIAAAPGIITFKQDGFEDNHCSCSGSWNAVYVTHSDGSVTWYGHLKSGSTTAKDSGDVVAVGEYLGIIGSSGCSTNPHLHLEVYDNLGNRIEPFFGPSNNTTNMSWWQNQLPYYDSGVNKIATHSTGPTAPTCPGIEVPNEKDVFNPSDPITFSVAIRHSLTIDSAVLQVFEPDGDQSTLIDLTYIRAGTFFSRAVLPFWNRTLSGSAPTGKWLYRVTYYSTTYGITVTNKNFWVAQPCVANRVLAGTHTIDRYYQTSNTITSTANISGSTHIVYDAENITTLNPGFLAPVGSKLEIKTAGCN
jgi:murein DD-endopeptidase MepM/ murein hydrolase activator NlpD